MNKYGIDYGTTNSSIAISYINNGSVQTTVVEVEDKMPRVVMPSKVLVTETGYNVGREETKSSNVHMIVRKPKDYLAPKKDFQTSENEKAAPPQEIIQVGGKDHETVRLIAAVLEKLRLKAQLKARELGLTPSGVVMGVPVEYGEAQKKILKEALVKAGYYRNYEEADSKTEFVSEPVAVAVDYGLKITENKNVLVFDFGGGTLDIAVMNLKNDVSKRNRDHLHPHTVIAKEGADLGGELITKAFFVHSFIGPGKYKAHEIARAFGVPNSKDPLALWDSIIALGYEGDRFFEAVDKLKCALSSVERRGFDYTAPHGSLKEIFFTKQDIDSALECPLFNDSESILERINKLIQKVLDNPNVGGKSDIDSVIVAGGSSMIPRVRDLLYDIFPGQLDQKVGQIYALTSIVRGLSSVGCREDSILDDIVDSDYGFWDVGSREFCPVVSRGTKVADTFFDKAKGTGKYEDFKNNDPTSRQMDIRVMQRNKYGEADLGVISLFGTDDRTYRLYMNIDKKQGILRCFVFDTKDKVWLDDTGVVSRYECQYKLK